MMMANECRLVMRSFQDKRKELKLIRQFVLNAMTLIS
jgi:hypothetical protein